MSNTTNLFFDNCYKSCQCRRSDYWAHAKLGDSKGITEVLYKWKENTLYIVCCRCIFLDLPSSGSVKDENLKPKMYLKTKSIKELYMLYILYDQKLVMWLITFCLKRTTFYMSYCRSAWTLNIEFLKVNLVYCYFLTFLELFVIEQWSSKCRK